MNGDFVEPVVTKQRGGAAVERIVRAAKLYRTWGDCFGYFALATGGADLMLDPTLAYWDVAAIVPVVEGAGGAVTGVEEEGVIAYHRIRGRTTLP